jgi:hypothetical protein
VKTLRHVLVATIKGACRLQRQSDHQAHSTNELFGVGRRPTTSFISNGWRRKGPSGSEQHFVRVPATVLRPDYLAPRNSVGADGFEHLTYTIRNNLSGRCP